MSLRGSHFTSCAAHSRNAVVEKEMVHPPFIGIGEHKSETCVHRSSWMFIVREELSCKWPSVAPYHCRRILDNCHTSESCRTTRDREAFPGTLHCTRGSIAQIRHKPQAFANPTSDTERVVSKSLRELMVPAAKGSRFAGRRQYCRFSWCAASCWLAAPCCRVAS